MNRNLKRKLSTDTYKLAYDLGYEEYFYSDNYCFVEWPSKISQLLLDKTFMSRNDKM